ncbi:hypothetical protein DEJ48_23000 [Streptomyces venezuelae]|uniref:Integral membrane protein n=1 Tax=Streptomyces venezuelae TaxID=54571 RepID=A0A5P2C5E5_STRVZ|nr:hypothetical protein [Streptomyces venezuelae]QES35899.1 hypothetical protein DEJ48_23000 [Streptomyces venezuelae]
MTKFLLSVHVLAAILAVGSITVAASMFPRYALRALGGAGGGEGEGEGAGEPSGDRAAGIAALLHRVCRAYAVAGVAVPAFGIATAVQLGVLTDAWLIASLILTTIAAGLLALVILPRQEALLDRAADPSDRADGARRATARLAMLTGIFNVLWATVTVLMIVRPGSTTGA